MNQPLISVIIPIYGVGRYAEYFNQCVDSVLNQTYRNLEILLIDDGSPEAVANVCDDYARKDSRVKVLHKAHSGVSDARNLALDTAKGDYFAFVDNDDWIEPDTYERMMAHMLADTSLDIVYCACARYPRQGDEICFNHYPTGTVVPGREVARRILLDEIGSQIVFGLYKRFCWDNVRFPSGVLYEDLATTYQAFLPAANVGFLTEPFYVYRTNPQSISTTPVPEKSYHIYLAFKSHFQGAAAHFPEIADRCCAMAAHFAISSYFHYCASRVKELEPSLDDVRGHLDRNRESIRRAWDTIPRTRKLAIQLYYFSPALFKFSARLLHITGLQRRLGLDFK